MNKIFQVTLNTKEKILAAVIVLVFLATRLTNLTLLPIFTDEAIYIRWSEIAWSVRQLEGAKTLVFIPLSDGKQPLFMWFGGFFMQFINDHLWAGRFPAVLSGLGSVVAIWLVAWEIFKNKKISWLASIFYVIFPFTFLYDRLALADSMLVMWGLWALFINLAVIRYIRNSDPVSFIKSRVLILSSIILGLVYGFGLLTKSPAIFYWGLAPIAAFFFLISNNSDSLRFSDYSVWKWEKSKWNKFLNWLMFYLGAVVLGQLIMNIQRVSGMYHRIGEKNLEFIVTFEKLLEDPFALLYGNMYGTSVWFIGYFGWPLIIAALLAIVYGLINLNKKILFLTIILLIPWVSSAAIGKVLYPRYLLFFTPPLMLLSVYGIYLVTKLFYSSLAKINMQIAKVAALLIITSFFSYSIYFTSLLQFTPEEAPLPLQDKEQYVEGWPSGYGVNEIYAYLREEYNKNKKLAVGTEGTFGLMPFAFEILFHDTIEKQDPKNPDLVLLGDWPFDSIPQELTQYAVDRPTYYFIYQHEEELSPDCPVELVKKIEKPGGKSSIRLYKVKTQSEYKPIQCSQRKL